MTYQLESCCGGWRGSIREVREQIGVLDDDPSLPDGQCLVSVFRIGFVLR
jgi:hypothetical protein